MSVQWFSLIYQLNHIWLVAAQPEATPTPRFWTLLVDNQTLSALGLLFAAFLAGFSARKFFEDHQVTKLQAQLDDTKKQLESTAIKLQEVASKTEAENQLAKHLRSFLSPEALRGPLAKYLGEFPPDKHEALMASLMRQILAIPGHAWLCTPTKTVCVHVDFDKERNVPYFRTEVDLANDPLRELRESITNQQQLFAAMMQVSLNGIARVVVRLDSDHTKRITVMQGPGLSWSTEADTFRRIEQPTPSR